MLKLIKAALVLAFIAAPAMADGPKAEATASVTVDCLGVVTDVVTLQGTGSCPGDHEVIDLKKAGEVRSRDASAEAALLAQGKNGGRWSMNDLNNISKKELPLGLTRKALYWGIRNGHFVGSGWLKMGFEKCPSGYSWVPFVILAPMEVDGMVTNHIMAKAPWAKPKVCSAHPPNGAQILIG